MAYLFVVTDRPSPTQLRVFYIAADNAQHAKFIASEFAKQANAHFEDPPTPLPGLRPESLELQPGEIKAWPVGETLNPLQSS